MKRIVSRFTRRDFVEGSAAAAALGGLIWTPARASAAPGLQPELRGPVFNLEITELAVNYTGRRAIATAVNGQVPAPVLRVREGDAVTLQVTNRLREMTSIHWH